MRSTFFLILLIFSSYQSAQSQTKARISDVDFFLEDNCIVVNYNLTGALPKEMLTIELNFITENNETLDIKTLTGDIGTNVTGDGRKEIRWDINGDNFLITGNLKAVVKIKSSRLLFSGPSNAALSVIVPGLGGYFVEKNKTRSIITTLSTVGLMVYGISQKSEANKYYREYNTSTVNADIQNLYSKANKAQNKYYIATRVGAGIWVADIIWVYFKGVRNKNEAKNYNKSANNGLSLKYEYNGVQFAYSLSF